MHSSEELNAFVLRHTRESKAPSSRSGRSSHSTSKNPVNMVFCNIDVIGHPDWEEFLALTQMVASESPTIDPLDGEEHSYRELDAWTGDRATTLRYMALGTHLGFFKLLSASDICSDRTMVERLAAYGYLGIRATESASLALQAA